MQVSFPYAAIVSGVCILVMTVQSWQILRSFPICIQ